MVTWRVGGELLVDLSRISDGEFVLVFWSSRESLSFLRGWSSLSWRKFWLYWAILKAFLPVESRFK